MPASYGESKDDLIHRLRKIGGQVRGVERMVQEEKYCVDVLIQIAAARAALDRVGTIIFEHHARGCLKTAMVEGRQEEMVDELLDVMSKFMK